MRPQRKEDPSARKKELLKLAEAGLDRLADELASSRTTEAMKTWLKFLGRFARYSKTNQLLVWAQRPQATLCNGYRTWQKLGRQVKRGERGLTIFAPMLIRREIEVKSDGGGGEETEVATGMAFRLVHVFDIDQTEGDPLPQHPATNSTEVSAADLRRVERAVGTLAPLIEDDPSNVRRGLLGFTDGKVIHVTAGQTSGARLSVLVHETAHFLMHFQEERRRRSSTAIRDVEELEAEATACAVSAALGYEFESFSSAYLKDYKATPASLRRSLPRIQTATKKIIGLVLDQ